MIFNLAGGNSGGGTSGWTDISSEFMAINPDVDEIYAITDGTLVYVSINNGAGIASGVETPADYMPYMTSYGAGISNSFDAIIIVADGSMVIQEVHGDVFFMASIIYPLDPNS